MSFYTSLSGLRGAQTDLSVISNNVANVGSVGFKRSRAQFGDIMPPSTSTAGQGTRLKGIAQQFSQGGFETSARDLDMAISGQGFFVTRDALADGRTSFTRNGSMQINGERYLTDSMGGFVQGLPVDADGNPTAVSLAAATPIQLPETNAGGSRLSDVSINDEGLVTASFADGSTQPLAKLLIANFPNPEGLKQQGDARWAVTGESGAVIAGTAGGDGFGRIQTGALERANVDITEELVALIAAQRNFQANAKAIETANTMSSAVINMRS